MLKDTPISLHGPAGNIEGILTEKAGIPVRAIGVVCHPHPLHQGTMNNKVVHTLARAFAAAGIPAARFNFRGVGESEGEYDGGAGETNDALAVVAAMRARHGDLPLWLAGFSFGSYVALRASQELEMAGLIMVAPPIQRFEFLGLKPPSCPWLVVQGDADEVVAADEVVLWVDSLYPGPELLMFPGVGHFFHGKLTDLREAISEFLTDA